MKIFKFIFAFIALALIGGFGYFAVADIPVTPKEITKEIPHDRLFPQDKQ